MSLKKILFLIGLFISVLCFSQSQKGIWLTDVASKALDSKEGIKQVVQDCKNAGIEQIYVVVWNRGHTLYPSEIMEEEFGKKVAPRFADRDMLKELIDEAHKENIKVHAWFEFGFSSSYKESDGGHILRSKPHWKAIDNKGNLATKNNFQWMNAFHPEVQSFLLSLIVEVIDKYDVDGIQGDDRLPANPSLAGYDDYTTNLYKQENDNKLPPKDYKNDKWLDWRAKKLNLFMKKIHDTVRDIKPSITITMAPSIYPWSKSEYLQDWPNWVENGWVDFVIPQVYRYDIMAYTNTLDANLKFVSKENLHKFIPGLLLKVDDYRPSNRFLKKMIKTNRKRGLDSEVFFFYEGLKLHKHFFRKKYSKF